MTIGVIGTGRIGTAVIERLSGFSCRVLSHDRGSDSSVGRVSLDELVRQSDLVTLHTGRPKRVRASPYRSRRGAARDRAGGVRDEPLWRTAGSRCRRSRRLVADVGSRRRSAREGQPRAARGCGAPISRRYRRPHTHRQRHAALNGGMTRAASALGTIGDPVTVGTLRQALADGDRATQMWAIRSLGQLRDCESVDLLIAALEDPSDRVRRAAAMALAKLGDPRALDPMRRAHDQATGFTQRRIGRALGELEAA